MTVTPTGSLHAQGCIFCRQHDGGFTSVEHVLPESLGNIELVLPRGVVCDRCNTLGSRYEQDLLLFPPIALYKVIQGQVNKKGRRPSLNWDGVTVSSPSSGHIVVEHREPDDQYGVRNVRRLGGNRVQFQLTVKGDKPLSKRAARQTALAIWKATFEGLYLDHSEAVFEERFDPIRELILGSRLAHGYLLVAKSAPAPSSEVTLRYRFAANARGALLPSELIVGGIWMMTELLQRDFQGDRATCERDLMILEF